MSMKRLLFGIFTALLSFALGLACASVAQAATRGRARAPQSVASKSDEDDGGIKTRSSSPYEIARAIREVRARREEFKSVALDSTWKRLGVPAGEFSACP